MKPLVVILVAALSITVGADADARPRRHHRVRAGIEQPPAKAHVTKHRARGRVRRSEPRRSYSDEIALSPALMRQLQRNLVDGGYYSGAIDGALGARTRAALADFQREYHLAVSGHLNRATAEALLGRDAVASAGPRARG
ncbi:MAG TPA: peptidoglycan-binding domain-containing protein [Polyangia bacterium]